ncbi:MAG: aspartate kinase [Bacteroidales bacterium]|nr:aspartate kinase [Bacteroidales bacterium]
MKIFKFGGASVNSAEAVRNAGSIIRREWQQELVVVFSAMGKTTNMLEEVVNAAWHKTGNTDLCISKVQQYHAQIINDLFPAHHIVHHLLEGFLLNLSVVAGNPSFGYDEFYDRVVSFGELISTAILSLWLDEQGLSNILLPAPSLLKTDNHFRGAAILWPQTCERIQTHVRTVLADNPGHFILTQGFIGSTTDGRPTTLGREGSDFTAAVLAYCLDAQEVIVWKDVDGLLNADPVYFDTTQLIPALSYRETIELAYYGAKILHPKTIKPLRNKNIPLRIRSFFHPELPGSVIHASEQSDTLIPFFILKKEQLLLSFSTRDFSFINEEKLKILFGVFSDQNIRINLMQNSAISFTVCINHPQHKLSTLLEVLGEDFEIRYNEGLELLTIRHFESVDLQTYVTGCRILLEQRSRRTLQIAYQRTCQ